MKSISRRSFLYGGLCTTLLSGLSYSQQFEPYFLQRSYFTLKYGWSNAEQLKTTPSVRILHLSDLHFSPESDPEIIYQACSLGMNANPDVVVITGDLIDLHLPDTTPLQDILYSLSRRVPTFTTVGNHDGGNWAYSVGGYKDPDRVIQAAREAGVIVLNNTSYIQKIRGKEIQLVGVGDLWSGDFKPDEAFANCRSDLSTILLSHNPDSKTALAGKKWDLMLSGHTHGGQLRIPWIGATPFAPVQDKRYVAGLNDWRDRQIYTSTGIATSALLRFNVRPEVTIFDLTLS